jgi:nitrite reductase/ring-hydroxylating ferredoxin subunit
LAARERVIAMAGDLVDGGDGVRFVVERAIGGTPAFAIRFRGVVYAYLNVCAHQELELDWQPGAFFDADRAHLVCSAHGAVYEPDTGRCVGGPCAGAALVPVPVRERGDGAIVVAGDRD